ncbi:urea ABC transporter permease subunit UrtB [Sulfitobacter sp. S190]|uniref:urea ABC transporter permease subunit UrtB n=1 Tax=Sulfitobacter sp. S190 TaxID=2867022 RepID=UPI0021A67C49|nr:urea ABC transporter permease subunit UrtB [Sulfitobacter sp. S190]UWR21736.1 urea ABC transporter permease subunit UrtB [Sulfitobacter sp. S190]
MLRLFFLVLPLWLVLSPATHAQGLQDILQVHAEEVIKPGRRSVGTVLDDLAASGLPQAIPFLEAWRDRAIVRRDSDGLFFRERQDGDIYVLYDLDTGARQEADPDDVTQTRPNGGVRRAISNALVQFQLSDPDIGKRRAAVAAIARSMDASQLAPLQASIAEEPDAALQATKARLAGMLGALFGENSDVRIASIEALADDLSVDVRAVLNRVLSTRAGVAQTVPQDANIAQLLEPGAQITPAQAYAQLVAAELAPPLVEADAIRAALIANIDADRVADVPVSALGTDAARLRAYDALAAQGVVPQRVSAAQQQSAVDAHVFFLAYDEPDRAVTDAAAHALIQIETRVAVNQTVDLGLDALSLASIYFLAAIGLAITFGAMGVINMAHGEFIMMGAYTGFVVQQVVPDYTVSLIIALPLAFAITFGAGVAMERLIIRHLYHRPLETLLATFGISIALQQLAKNIFGTQARPLTSPQWLDGALVFNDVIAISYIRIAIFVLALVFLGLILFVLKRTRLGLEVRAVTQNPGMAASMGINPDRINMLTFGFGSGIAGIAGVAIGLYAKVTSEMGADYIVQSFMTVVVGGVGNVWGTLAGASMIGFLQKGIEWFNPSNTLAAQTYMILFIILFIQFRPKGIVALKGRAAAD